MSTRARLHGRALLLTYALFAPLVSAAPADYPAPRFPQWLVKPSDADLLSAARVAVRQTFGRSPLGNVKRGETVHVLISADQNMRVFDAVRRAWAERGVAATAVPGWEWSGMTRADYEARAKRNQIGGDEGWKEFGVFEPAFIRFLPADARAAFRDPMTTTAMLGGISYPTDLDNSPIKKFLDRRPDVQNFYAFAGGGPFVRRAAGEQHGRKFRGNWIYLTPSDLESHAPAFPADLWRMIDEHVVRPIPNVAEGTFVDPQGTRLHWYLTSDQSRLWDLQSGLKAYIPGHLNIYPSGTGATWTEGVVVAESNHAAYFPQMTVRLTQHGRIDRIEGGGRAGDLFRALVSHPAMKDAAFPSAPEIGYWYLAQDGIGTNPKVVRNYQMLTMGTIEMPNLTERDRAGVQHFAFSSPVGPNPEPDPTSSPEDVRYARDRNLPLSHVGHMHEIGRAHV